MKGRILAGALSVSLLLTGCASMLTREYGSVEPHSATLVSEGTPTPCGRRAIRMWSTV